MNRILLQIAKWYRRPPSRQTRYAVLAAIAVAVIVWGLGALGWWPEWATANRIPRIPLR